MKYIKLFEQFDKYNFREYSSDKGDDLYLIFDDLIADAINITVSEFEEIKKVHNKASFLVDPKSKCKICYIDAISLKTDVSWVTIYSLSDYCYCIVYRNSYHSIVSIFVVDGMEEVCDLVNNL